MIAFRQDDEGGAPIPPDEFDEFYEFLSDELLAITS